MITRMILIVKELKLSIVYKPVWFTF